MKWCIVFIIGIVCVFADDSDCENFRIIDSIRQEEPCSRAGGMCVIADDCPTLAEKRGLCPSQRSRGVECCYGVSVKETRCGKNGGECFPAGTFCRNSLRFYKATDCPKGSTCCILVNKK